MRRTLSIVAALAFLASAAHAAAGDLRVRMPDGPAYEGSPIVIVLEVADAAKPVPPRT